MRLLIALLAVVAFASCAAGPVQRWPHIDSTYYCEAPVCPSLEDTEATVVDFVMMWSELFRPCDPAGIDLTWTPFIADHVLGRYVRAWNLIDVLPAADHPENVANTALPHELVHMCLGQGYNDSDHDHAEGKGPWSLRVQIFLDVYEDMLRKRLTHEL